MYAHHEPTKLLDSCRANSCLHSARVPSRLPLLTHPAPGRVELAACKALASKFGTRMQLFEYLFRSLMVQRDQWDRYYGPKKEIF